QHLYEFKRRPDRVGQPYEGCLANLVHASSEQVWAEISQLAQQQIVTTIRIVDHLRRAKDVEHGERELGEVAKLAPVPLEEITKLVDVQLPCLPKGESHQRQTRPRLVAPGKARDDRKCKIGRA